MSTLSLTTLTKIHGYRQKSTLIDGRLYDSHRAPSKNRKVLVANDLSTDPHGYAAATQNVRESAKWLLAAAAGVGGVLIAGLGLGSLGDLTLREWPRIVVALIGLMLALAGVGAVITSAGTLLTQDWASLRELGAEDIDRRLNTSKCKWRRRRADDAVAIYEEIGVYGDELYGDIAHSPEELWRMLTAANESARAGVDAANEDVVRADQRLRSAIYTVVQFANYRRVQANFSRLKRVLMMSSAAVVAGVVVFALAAHSPAKPEDTRSENRPTQNTAEVVLPTKPSSPAPSTTRLTPAPASTHG
jgi:hypothetical protein